MSSGGRSRTQRWIIAAAAAAVLIVVVGLTQIGGGRRSSRPAVGIRFPAARTLYVCRTRGAADPTCAREHTGADAGHARALSLAELDRVRMPAGATVLLRGGDRWDDAYLAPVSGEPGQPTTYGSYGSDQAVLADGRDGGAFFAGVHDVVLRDLDFEGDTLTGPAAAISSTPRDPSSHITIEHCTIRHWRRGIYVAGPDSFWLVAGSTISDIGKDGVMFDRVSDSDPVPAGQQTNNSVIGDTIVRTGLNFAVKPARTDDPGTHAIYDNSLNSIVRGNTITDFDSSAVSIRYRNSTVEANRIDGAGRGGLGIGFFGYDHAGGRSTWADNTMRGLVPVVVAGEHLAPTGIYVAGTDRQPTRESFVITGNTIVMDDPSTTDRSAKIAIGSIQGAPSGVLQIEGNTASGPSALEFISDRPFSQVASTEQDNVWWNGDSTTPDAWAYAGRLYRSLADYQAGTHLGQRDRNVDPHVPGAR